MGKKTRPCRAGAPLAAVVCTSLLCGRVCVCGFVCSAPATMNPLEQSVIGSRADDPELARISSAFLIAMFCARVWQCVRAVSRRPGAAANTWTSAPHGFRVCRQRVCVCVCVCVCVLLICRVGRILCGVAIAAAAAAAHQSTSVVVAAVCCSCRRGSVRHVTVLSTLCVAVQAC